MSTSLFANVEMAPRDPILGLTEAYNAEKNPSKVNLGVGVYFGDDGKIPLLAAVKAAEKARLETQPPRGYQPIEGTPAYNGAVQALLFGKESEIVGSGRASTFQCLGGTGALRVGADYLKALLPNSTVYISDPSWENHRQLFEAVGFKVDTYGYYDPATRGVNFAAMKASLAAMPPKSIVLLHACCHNPTGADLTNDQWKEVIAAIKDRDLVAYIDMAYQGFAEGIEQDGETVRQFAASGLQFFVASSFSKSFSLYGERVGALTVVTASKDEAARVTSQIKRLIRTNYSNPPTHGGAIVAACLGSTELRQMWEEELGGMRNRIRAMRSSFVDKLKAEGKEFGFINVQRGMFSYTGLTAAQVEKMRAEYGIYAVSTGRICVAALNTRNIDYVVKAVAAVL
jgi:aromatic-amino-acid transaminase